MVQKWLLHVVLLSLVACSSNEDLSPDKQSSKVTFSLVADTRVNPNVWGESSPVEVQVIELKDDSMFLSAGYDQLKADYKKALRSNFIKNYDYVLTPSQFKFVSAIDVDEETNYIGVIAHFSDPEISEWKQSVKVLNVGREYHLLMFFKDYEVKLDKVE